MKKHVLIIGAGGVAKVVAHKCAQNNNILGDIHIASRTLEKCEAIVASIREVTKLRGEVAFRLPGELPNDGKVIEDARKYS